MRDIAMLEKGELVFTVNQRSNKKKAMLILKKMTHPNRYIWQIDFTDGTFIKTTAIHSFFVQGKWKKTNGIRLGQSITTFDEYGSILSKVVKASFQIKETETVFNLVVQTEFTFLANGCLVHSFTYFRTIRKFLWALSLAIFSPSHTIKSGMHSLRQVVFQDSTAYASHNHSCQSWSTARLDGFIPMK
jgi:hypothetical protein